MALQCGKCRNKNISLSANFCDNCGNVVMVECKECGDMEPYGEKYCRRVADSEMEKTLISLKRIQKYTGLVAGVALFLAVSLGLFLYSSSLSNSNSLWVMAILIVAFFAILFLLSIVQPNMHKKKEQFREEHSEYYVLNNIKVSSNI